MRLRQSNRNKSYRPQDLNLGLGSSDEDESPAVTDKNDLRDGGFVGDDAVEEEQEDDDEAGEDTDETAASDSAPNVALPVPAPSRAPRNRKSGGAPPPISTKPLGFVQEYPADPTAKWTRTYPGPVKRWNRILQLTRYWFGEKEDYLAIVDEFFHLWWHHQTLPPRLTSKPHITLAQNPWKPTGFLAGQQERLSAWRARYMSNEGQHQASDLIDENRAYGEFFPKTSGNLNVFIGHPASQQRLGMQQGVCLPLSATGEPLGADNPAESASSGWLMDVGGIVMSMGWAPSAGTPHQLLAMSVIPFSDQQYRADASQVPRESEKQDGAVQIWKFHFGGNGHGASSTTRQAPGLAHTLCSSWGRAIKLRWCPVAVPDADCLGILAVLYGDRRIRVFDIRNQQDFTFEEVHVPLAIIVPPPEDTVEISAFTWINLNRIAAGHTDGTVTVWSVYPCQPLQRHPVHMSTIMDISSGYPSQPFVVATNPMGGVSTLTDLGRPTGETSCNPNLSVCMQQGLLCWSELMGGHVSVWPSAFAGNSQISFSQSRVFPQARQIMVLDSPPTCLDVGVCHPFVMVGTADGSVWVCNVFRRVYYYRERTSKLRVFQHEYRAPPPPEEAAPEGGPRGSQGKRDGGAPLRRGACRLLSGFLPEVNNNPKTANRVKTYLKNLEDKRASKKGSKGGGRSGKVNKMADLDDSEDEDDDDDEDDENQPADAMMMDGGGGGGGDGAEDSAIPEPIVIHDSQTRITAVAWNPNVDFSWWAAAAMGSGLVRVMDLGVDDGGGAAAGASAAKNNNNNTGGPSSEDESMGDD